MIILKNVNYYDTETKNIRKNYFFAIKKNIIFIIDHMRNYDGFIKHSSSITSEIDCFNLILFPGLVNSHLHPSKELYYGLNDFDRIKDVLDKVHKNNKLETKEMQHIATLYSILNQIKSGVTSIGIFTSRPSSDIDAIKSSKIRANIHYCQSNQWIGSGEEPKLDNTNRLINNYISMQEKLSSDLIYMSPATASELSADKFLLSSLHNIAKEFNKKLFLHIHEGKSQVSLFKKYYSSTAIEYLNELKILDKNTSLIHCSYLSKKDISILNNTEPNIIHCPVSNSYVGASKMPIYLLKNKNIGLGTDAAMVNPINNILFESLFCLYHHGTNNLSKKVSSSYILKMIMNSETLDIPNIGEINIGRFADLIFLEKDNASLNNPISILMHLYNTPPVHVMINGEFIIKDKFFTNTSFNHIKYKFNDIINQIKG